MNRVTSHRGAWTKAWRWIIVAMPALLYLLLVLNAQAHAALDASDPEANAVLASPPAEVRLWFTEPLEVQYSGAQLFDVQGSLVDTPESRVAEDDPNLLILPLPADLELGTYTVAWHNISTVDGHPAEGLLIFTIGTQSNVQTPAPPEARDYGGPPTYVEAIGRWLNLLGATAALGLLVTGFWVVRPAIESLQQASRHSIGSALRGLVIVAAVVALLGNGITFIDQLLTVETSLSVSGAADLLTGSEFGRLWLIRVSLLILLGGLVIALGSWAAMARQNRRIPLAFLAAAILVPIALNSHAAALNVGRGAAVAADLIHLIAAGIWVGGLLALATTVTLTIRTAADAGRREALAKAVPRFSSLGIISLVALSATGLYSAWLQVGNLYALTETDYGHALIVKLVLVGIMVALGAVNLLLVEPRLRRAASSGAGLRRTVGAEVLVGAAVLLLTGVLTGLPTGRGVVEAESGRSVFHLTEGDTHVTLYVSPGAVGMNRYTAEFDQPGNEPVAEGSEVLLHVSTDGAISGEQEITLGPSGPDRFEASGNHLSVVGDWNVEVILRQPGEEEWRVETAMAVQETPPEERAPGPSPRFLGANGLIWVVIAALSVPVIVLGWRHGRSMVPVGAGSAILLASAFGLLTTAEMVGRPDEMENPIPATQASISQGEALFQDNCVRCHGEDATGSGPVLGGQNPNADLTASHVNDHPDGQVHRWIRQGIGGTPMPGFADALTDEEIWHLVNYVRTLQE